MTKFRIFLTILLAITAVSCVEQDPNAVPTVKSNIDVDGCHVSYIENPHGWNFFIARCDNTITTTEIVNQGKSGIRPIPVVKHPEVEDLRKQLADAEAREQALSKLTPGEIQLLGIKQ